MDLHIILVGKEPVLPEKFAQEVTRRIIPTEPDDEILDALNYLVRSNVGVDGPQAVTLDQMTKGFDEAMKQQLLHRLKELLKKDKLLMSTQKIGTTTRYWPVHGALMYALPRPPLFRWMRSETGVHPDFPDLPNHILRFVGYEKRPVAGGSDHRNEWWKLQVIIGARSGEVLWLPRICHASLQVFSKPMFDPVFNQK